MSKNINVKKQDTNYSGDISTLFQGHWFDNDPEIE